MNICFITNEVSKLNTPLMNDVKRMLGRTHAFDVMVVPSLAESRRLSHEIGGSLADLYLLKCHVPGGLELARVLEERGARVINHWAATQACQDRKLMAERLQAAGLPWPRTWALDRFAQNLDERLLETLNFPVMIKGRYAYEGTIVERADDAEQLCLLARYWGNRPVIIQEYLAGDGWDTKVWVIDEQVFAAKRRSPLDDKPQDQFQLTEKQLGEEVKAMALAAGRAFGLRIYDVDFLITQRGPVIVDVNSFPRFRGLVGPEKALVALIERECYRAGAAPRELIARPISPLVGDLGRSPVPLPVRGSYELCGLR